MLNILDHKRKNNSTSAFISKQSSVVVLRKNKFKARIGKYLFSFFFFLIIKC